MASLQTTQVDRVSRSLKRLGFRMTRVGRSFTIIGNSGEPAAGSKTRMSLAEIELWIGEHIRRLWDMKEPASGLLSGLSCALLAMLERALKGELSLQL